MSTQQSKDGAAPAEDAQIKHMVKRFLQWRLLENLNPDGGISFEPIGNHAAPVGEELRKAAEAFLASNFRRCYGFDGRTADELMANPNHRKLCPECALRAALSRSAVPAATPLKQMEAYAVTEEAARLRPAIMEMMAKRDWDTRWPARLAYLNLEAAELAEAVRGKRGDTLDESADGLITLLALSPHGLEEIIPAAAAKVARLLDKPRYEGESGNFGDVPVQHSTAPEHGEK